MFLSKTKDLRGLLSYSLTAIKHIKQAAANGADLIKIQTYEPKDITLNSKKKAFVLKEGLWKNKNLFEIFFYF